MLLSLLVGVALAQQPAPPTEPVAPRAPEFDAVRSAPGVAQFYADLDAAALRLREAHPAVRGQLVATRGLVLQFSRDGMTTEPEELAKMYKASCETYRPACTAHRWIDPRAAARELGERCERRDGLGCLALGWATDDPAFFQLACDAGLARGCWEVAAPEADGPLGADSSLLEPACLEGWPLACRAWGRNAETDFLEPKPGLAAVLYRTACDLFDARACTELGRLYETGSGLEVAPITAGGLYSVACTAGDGAGCLAMGKLYELGKGTALSVPEATRHYSLACEAGNGEGCLRVGGLAAETGNAGEAITAWNRGCAAGDATSCLRLATLYDPQSNGMPNPFLHAEALAGACRSGLLSVCIDVGRRYLYGQWIRVEPQTAVELFEVACHQGEVKGCYSSANVVVHGRAPEHDSDKLLASLDRSCDLGTPKSCKIRDKVIKALAEQEAEQQTKAELEAAEAEVNPVE